MPPTQSLTTLLSTESLLFAVFSVSLGFGSNAAAYKVTAKTARRVATGAAIVLTLLALGAMTAWVAVFVTPCTTHGFLGWAPALMIALGAVAQPVFGWVLARQLTSGSSSAIV